ncbi:telomere repeat-binding protein 5 isoform X1 [Rosa chinensis]|uniref:telomere repeat-binding protein 5 isoform X1 n=1 Tax=Rosa chinensis TaxID=74649 RepID=UPI000D088933|nr:telomere repeat-binding protein 5 isoform X1 [Rosa chinensis]XP_024156561.1 telomere repeat-binding protein 5 isoform X1 [Rosa chinensis]
MVLQKRLDYGFNGFQVPVTPRAPRSARRRSTISKRDEDNSMGAFDLLATVAGKLLLEGESSPASSHTSTGKEKCSIVNDSCPDGDKPLKVEPCDQGSCDRKFFVSDNISQGHNQSCSSKESPVHQNESHSVMTTSNCSERFVSDMLVGGKCKNEIGSFTSKVQAGSSVYRESGECKLDGEAKVIVKDETNKRGEVLIGTGADMCSLEDPMVWEGEPPALVSSDSSTKVPICVDHIPQKPILASRDDVKIVSRDDDENSSGCTHPSTTTRYLRTAQRIGDRRIRKVLASRYWKAAPKMKDGAYSNSYRDMRPIYHGRKNGYKRQRSQMNMPFKKRRLFDRSTVLKSNGGISSESFFDSGEKGITGNAPASCSKMQGANAISSSVAGQHSAFQSRNSHVKLRIKSFRVPELFIEIPETATVGSLKKTVMDAVTAVLGGGLCVGVLLQGKKLRDDTKTLQQTGISQDDQIDSLGFTLEPNPPHTPTPLCSGDSPRMLPCDVLQPLTRYAPDPSSEASLEPHMAALGSFIESDHDSAPSPTDTSADKSTTDSKALVVVPEMSAEALAVVPGNRKSKRFDIGQRRIRRPFSVAEVEALVQAVEKLGTGRWRDVKMRAFENAKHRTYVDLKDKWKTLVHTARISPQQRRGEPVPQELLDRVLTAHAYWSQQQAKQQLKHPESCVLV